MVTSLGECSVGADTQFGDDAVGVDVRVDVRSVDEDADCSGDRHGEEDVQL